MSKKIFIKSFGCQMNEYDSNRIFDIVKSIGYEKSNDQTNADCYIINTCHIRDKAKEKVFHQVGRVKQIYSNKKKPVMIIAGCVAQAENQEMLKREPYIDVVIGPQSYHKINKILNNFQKNKKEDETEFDTIAKFDLLSKTKNSDSKVSSFLTIQEGCDKFCHFCVVPYTRGPEYSRPIKQIISEVNNLINNGAREIVLLGQNVNAYNFSANNKKYKLSDLIRKLNYINGLKRIRYITSHPKDMTQDLIDCYKDCEKLMTLIHLPIQSGSDRILKAMNRQHDTKHYLEIVKKIKKINKDIRFSSDFIVGYPGETEQDYRETVDFIKNVGFINSYSFIFSPRLGTPAAKKKLNNLEENKQRLKNLQDVLKNIQLKNNNNFLGEYCEVLVENQLQEKGKFFGRTKVMTPVIFESENCKLGELVNVKVTSLNQNNLFGFHKNNKVRAA